MALLDLIGKDIGENATQGDVVKVLRTKFPEFSGMKDEEVAATLADADASAAFLKAYDPTKSLKPAAPITPVKVAASLPAAAPAAAPAPGNTAVEDFRKKAALPDNLPADILEEVLRGQKPELFKSAATPAPGSSNVPDTADEALKIAVGYALPKLPDSLQRLAQANAAGTLAQAADVASFTEKTPGVAPISNLSEPLKRAARAVMPAGPLSKGERFLSGDKRAAAEAFAPTEADIEKKATSGTIPYFDIARKTLADTVAPLIPNPLNPIEDAMWAAIPAAERTAIGTIAEGAGVGKVAPVLRGYVQSGVLGAAFGAMKAPEDGQAKTYLKRVGEGLAAGILLHGMASGVDAAAQELGVGKINAYRNLRQTIIDQFVEKGVYPKEAAAMTDFGIDQAIKTGGKWEDVTAADLRAAKAAVLRGEKLILGNAEEPVEPAAPAELKGPSFDAGVPENSPEAPKPAAPTPNITTIDGSFLGGPEGVQALETKMPLLASTIVGRDFPFTPEVVGEAINQATAIHDSSLQTGLDPNDAQVAGTKAFTDYLNLVQKPPTAATVVPPGTSKGDTGVTEAPSEPLPISSKPEKPVRTDDRGIPIRKPNAVVMQVAVAQGRTFPITHRMVLQEAQGLLQQAKDSQTEADPLGRFVMDNGGLRSFKALSESGLVPEAEEMKTVPIRFKRKTGLPADEMAHMAHDAGLIQEPSADVLREKLKRIKGAAAEPTLGQFYEEALRNLEHFASNPEIYGGADDTGIVMHERARNEYRSTQLSNALTAKQPAYHGTPHKFDKFSLQKIGTGEGNQVFGWGLYFSGKKDVAEFYRRMLTPPQEIPANVRLAFGRLDNLGFDSLSQALKAVRANPDDWAQKWDVESGHADAKTINQYIQQPLEQGHVYHVDIPEDDQYLDWDKPLSEQSPKVKAIWEKDIFRHFVSSSEQINSKSTGANLYAALERDLGDDAEKTSKFLLSKGIPGLRYLDQASRISGEGTYNYVLFDDSKVKILGVSEPLAGFDLTKNGATIEPGMRQLSLDLNFRPTQSEKQLAQAPAGAPEPTGEIYIGKEKVGKLVKDSPFAVQYKKDGFLTIPNKTISGPADVAFAFQFLKHQIVENFFIGAVKDGRIVSVEHIAVGTFDQVAAHPFEAIQLLDHSAADSYFIVHNHPSGHTDPSHEDLNLTRVFKRIFDQNGIQFLGHVVINDTHFGFIDKNLSVAQYEHKDFAKTREIPILKKYAEWAVSKNAYRNQPVVSSPKTVFEIAKGIQLGDSEALALFLNVQNSVNASLVVPHSQITVGNLQLLAGRYRGAGIILVNSGLPSARFAEMRTALSDAGIRLIDNVELLPNNNFRSATEMGAFEKPGEYNLRDRSLDDEYDKARREGTLPQPKETTAEFLQQRKNVISDFFKYIGQVSSKSLFKIGPELMYATRRFESDYRQQTKKDLMRSEGFLKSLGELKKKGGTDHLVMDLAMKNGDMAMQSQIAREYGFLDELNKVRTLLEEMRGRIQSVGYQVGYRTGYFPRVIRDKKGLRKFISAQDEIGGEIDYAIREKELELGRQLNDDEKANLINSFIRGFVRSKIALAKTGNMKKREIEKVTVDLNKFYYSGREGLIRYIEQVNEAVEARKFFGRVEVKPELDAPAKAALAEMSEEEKKQSALSWNNIQDSIGAYVNRLLDQKKINADQQLELKNIFLSRFGYIGTSGIFGLYKNLEYMSTIANPIAGLSQLDDLAAALYLAPWNTPGSFVRALAGKSKISLHDLGLESIAEEIREASKTSAGLRWQLRKTGFTYFDRVMKETHTNALIDSYREKVRSGDPELDSKLFHMFGSQADSVIDDLKAGRTTENVLFLAFNELSDYQPITLLEVPRAYQDSPGGRVFYMLKTFFLKRLDFLMSTISRAPDKKTALKNFLHLYALMIIAGAGVDVAKDLILGRKINPTDLVIDNLIKPFGISKFLLYRVRDYGPAELAVNYLTPSHKLLDSIWKDIRTAGTPIKVGNAYEPKDMEIPGAIPVGGKLWYWWFGRGAQKERAKAYKQQNSQSGGKGKPGGGMYNF